VVIRVIGQREFQGLLDDMPGLAAQLLAGTAARLAELDTQGTA
jgi:hypothetical protein